MANSKCFTRLHEITCVTYDAPVLDNLFYLPTEADSIIEYNLQVEFKNIIGDILYTNIPTDVTPVFLNSRTGARYSLECQYLGRSNNLNGYLLRISSQAYEDSGSDILELVFQNDQYIGSLRLPIQVKKVKKSNRIFNYLSNGVKVKDSNLLARRVKIGFPLWGTVNSNINSTTLKLMEPLHSLYSSIYSKSNEYLLQSFDLSYSPNVFSRVFLKNYPKVITRILDNGLIEELKETDDIQAAPKKVESTTLLDVSDETLFSSIYDFKRNSEETLANLVNLNSVYLRLLDSSEKLFTACYITGYDQENNLLNEVIIVRKDMYTQLQNKFRSIIDIDCNEAIEITNYVDLRYSHYINERPYITPPISDTNLKTFKPEVVIKTNNELTHNIVTLNNNLIERGNEQYKYNIDTTKLRSFYLNDELDIIYLSNSTTGTTLSYSKLNVDYSSDIGDKTCNNNPYIELSDNNTIVGDWCDVIVNVDRLVAERQIKSFYLQITNKDSVYFYNSDTNSLVQEKVHIYTELLLTDIMAISIYVDNSEPYVFSIVDEQTGTKFSAMIENYKINPISTTTLSNSDTGYLIKRGNSITFVDDSSSDMVVFSEQDAKYENEICVFFNAEYYSHLDFVIELGDYYIRNNGTNLPIDSYCMYINRAKSFIYIYFDKTRLKELLGTVDVIFKVGTSVNQLNGILIEDLLNASVSVYDYANSFATALVPKVLTEDPHQIEYTVSFNIDDLQNLTFTRESDYD